MKLSEVTLQKTHLVFEDDSDTRTPDVGTEVEMDGNKYRFQGRMWAPVKPDGTLGPTGNVSRVKQRELTSQWRTSNPIRGGVFKLTPGVQRLADDRFMVTLPDQTTVVETASRADAEAVQARVDELNDKTPRQITTAVKADIDGGKLTTTKFTRSWSLGRAIRNATQADFEAQQAQRATRLGGILNNPMFRTVMKVAGAAAIWVGPFWGMMIEVGNINQEIEEAQRSGGDVQRLQDIRNILQGQIVAYYAANVARLLTKIKYVRQLMAPIRMAVRGGQVATALTGVGAPAAFLSMIVSEALWIVIPLILSTTSIQRWLAEIIVDSSLKDYFVLAGRGLENVTGMANTFFDGRFGTGALAKAVSGYDPKEAEGITGEYYGESEWAKLVFGILLFPPDQKSRLVPYIPKNRRDVLLSGTLGLNPMDADEVVGDQEGDQEATDGGMDAIDRRMDGDAAVTRNPEVNEPAVDANGETAADRGRRTREQSLQTDFSNPNFTRAQPMSGPR